MISVIVPALIREAHHLQMTVACIEAARKNTKLPFELVIVETGSTYLKDLADIYVYERVKTNSTISINHGFRVASGEKMVLLTNDVLVDEGWLEHLLECFDTRPDCGLATLASDQFGHTKEDKIAEGIWFSVAMVPREECYFDENFLGGSWDDSDIIMRTYIKGRRMYRNHKSVVHHDPGQTHYSNPTHQETFDKNRTYFLNKWRFHSYLPIYRILTLGIIV